MLDVVETRQLALGEFDERYSGLRLQATAEARQAMIQSLRRYGQLSPVVVWPTCGVWVLIDGFKRLEAARHLPELATLAARTIEVDARTAKAAVYGMNQWNRRLHLLEEAWIVSSLVREEGLTQPEAAQLLGHNKSWISRRLALLEKLCLSARDDLALGLLSPSMARQLTRLPVGNQEAQYLRFTESQDFETLLREHVRAFQHLGGVAATCLYDNMKTVVDRWESGEPVYNVRFLAFAAHYGFRPWACLPRRPQTKGKVERPFRYVESNLLNGRTFSSLEHLNQFTQHWLANTADLRAHRETRKRPSDAHAEELPHLLPLPAAPYDTAHFVYRTVDAEGMIAYERNSYSAPWRLVGRILPVRVTEEEIVLYDSRSLKAVGRHPLYPRHVKGQKRVNDEHRPSRNAQEQEDALRERFAELGESAVAFLEGLLRSHRDGKHQARKVLSLLATYYGDDVRAAFERAVRYRAFAFNSLERILAAQARPRPPLELLNEQFRPSICDDPPVGPRPTADYQELLEEPHNDDPPPDQDQ